MRTKASPNESLFTKLIKQYRSFEQQYYKYLFVMVISKYLNARRIQTQSCFCRSMIMSCYYCFESVIKICVSIKIIWATSSLFCFSIKLLQIHYILINAKMFSEYSCGKTTRAEFKFVLLVICITIYNTTFKKRFETKLLRGFIEWWDFKCSKLQLLPGKKSINCRYLKASQ